MPTTPTNLDLDSRRLALALLGAGNNGDRSGAASVMKAFTGENLPLVLAALGTMVVQALETPAETTWTEFLAARGRELDAIEQRRRSPRSRWTQ